MNYTIECNVALNKNIFQMHRYTNKGLDFPVTSYFLQKVALEHDHCYAHHCLLSNWNCTSWGKNQARYILYLLCRIQLWKVQFIVVNWFVQTVVNVQLITMYKWFTDLFPCTGSPCAACYIFCIANYFVKCLFVFDIQLHLTWNPHYFLPDK